MKRCLCVQGNLETVVEFLPRPRRPGLSLDHWLRLGPAKTDHSFAGVNSQMEGANPACRKAVLLGDSRFQAGAGGDGQAPDRDAS